MKKITSVLLGADPELFLAKQGKVISAVGLIGGTKHEPRPISDNGHMVQEDNIAIEYNIPASATKEDWINNHNFVKDYLEVHVTAMNCELNISASANLDKVELESDQAKQFGCEPDFNVWTQSINEPPQPGGTLRSCGGHIAIGFDKSEMTEEESDEMVERLIKAMDMTVGLKSLFLDKDEHRRKMYGKAGCFRFKDFGLEYRTLSNFWITNDETLAWAWDTTMEAIELVNSEKIDELAKTYGEKVVKAINTNDTKLATELLQVIEQEVMVAA